MEPTAPQVPILGRTNLAGIEATRKVLAMLESGELISVAIIGEKSDGAAAIYDAQGDGRLMTLLGAATMLVRRLQDHAIDRGKKAIGQFMPTKPNGS